GVLVLAVAGVLTLLQTSVYAGTAPFWRVGGLNRDDQLSFVLPEHPRDVLARGIELAPYFLEWNLAAPRTVIQGDGSRTAVDFPARGAVPGPGGIVRAVLGGALVLAAIVRSARTGSWRRPVAAALGLWTLALVALHLVFGTSLFLYSGQWTFAVLALAALGIGTAEGKERR